MSEYRYQLTEAGRNAWESQDIAVPSDYRLILWLVDFYGRDSVKNLVNRYPPALLREWFDELEELRLVELVPPGAATAPGLSEGELSKTDPFTELQLANFQHAVVAAGAALAQGGSFIAENRVNERPPSEKAPSDTVILIIEDDPDQLSLADLRVTMAGYSVRVADSASALFVNLAEKGTPDLLLLDVMLPDGNGFDLLAKLRAHRTYSNLPIVLLTAKTEAADIGRGLQLGADGYITKPYSKNILANVVRRVLRQDSTTPRI